MSKGGRGQAIGNKGAKGRALFASGWNPSKLGVSAKRNRGPDHADSGEVPTQQRAVDDAITLAEQVHASTVDVALDPEVIRAALRDDPEFFIHFFLGEQITREVPAFHKQVFNEMTHADVTRLVLAIPRAHSKTTLAKLAAVWYFLFSDYRFVLYVSGSHDLVVPYVNDIAAFFETPNFRAVFGPVIWEKKQDGTGTYKFRLPGIGNKVCILRGLGSGQRVRGINVDNQRPQLVIADDIEDDDTTKNLLMHQGLLDWWMGAFLKCLDPFHNKIIVCGNLTSKLSILWKLLHNQNWRSFLMGCLRANGEPLWEDLWPVERLRADFLEYQEMGKTERWFAEMMNQPTAEGGGLIESEHICYKPQRLPAECKFGFLTLDPAFSSNNWADRCAINAHGWIEDEQQWQIVETFYTKGMNAVDIYHKCISMATRWRFHIIGIELAGQQGGILQLFEHLRMTHIQTQFRFVPIPLNNRSKTERVAAFASMLSTKNNAQARYALTAGDFIITQQLLMYEPKKRDNDDDVVDSAAHGVIMINNYLTDIMQSMPGVPRARDLSLAEIAAV